MGINSNKVALAVVMFIRVIYASSVRHVETDQLVRYIYVYSCVLRVQKLKCLGIWRCEAQRSIFLDELHGLATIDRSGNCRDIRNLDV